MNFHDKHRLRHMSGRGFTLLETVVVFGVFGVVIGSIFVAARAVQQQANINRASDQLVMIANNMKDYYASRNVDMLFPVGSTPSGTPTFSDTVTQSFIRKSIFPAEMLDSGDPSTATTATLPWGGKAYIDFFRGANQPLQFAVQYSNIPTSSCVSVIERNSTPGRDTGLAAMILSYTKTQGDPPEAATQTVTYDNSSAATSLPITQAEATKKCRDMDAGQSMTVQWTYVLSNGCGVGAMSCN